MAIDGKYKVIVDTPMGKQKSTLTLKTSGDKLSGTADAFIGKADFTGAVKGNEVSWNIDFNSPMGNITLEFKGKVTGNDISGEIKAGDFGVFPFTGARI
jgi:hypothetical protein